MAQLNYGIFSHARKVCNLYKRVIRHVESTTIHYEQARYEAVLIRHEFDKNKNIIDVRVAKTLLEKAEEDLFNDHDFLDYKFPSSPEGCAYERDTLPPDWVLDYWEPVEKSLYPKYFSIREQRKKEYEEFYKKEYEQQPDHDKLMYKVE